MEIKINYDQEIISLPSEPLKANIAGLTEGEFRVLIYICSDKEFRTEPESCRARAIKELDMQWAQIEEALNLLIAHGVIKSANMEPAADTSSPKKSKVSVKSDSPVYTKEEAAGIIDRSTELKALIDNCCRVLKKISLTPGEITTLVSLYDYLRLSSEYILTLITYCAQIDKRSLRYIERMAYSLFDSDITTVPALNSYLAKEQKKDDIIHRLRDLFGIGERAFTAKEKKLIEAWLETYNYGFDVIGMAYELTIQAINEPSLPYAGAIMKKWYENGLRTAEDVAAYKPVKSPSKKPGAKTAESFDPDEFMALALQRSYPKDPE